MKANPARLRAPLAAAAAVLAAALAAASVAALASSASAEEGVLPALPPGVLEPEIPADNPPTAAKVELGRRLYFDARLSTDGTIACATCHAPESAFADPRETATSAGAGGALGARNAPTVLNAAFLATQFWDGRAATLEEQAAQPITNPIEHGFADAAAAEAKLRALPEYAPLFAEAFGEGEITLARAAQAIATFERTLISLDAPIDKFLAGDAGAISESARRGWELFNGKARCNTCHGHIEVLPFFTDDLFHNLGVGIERVQNFDALAARVAEALAAGQSIESLQLSGAEADELGRAMVSGEPKDIGAFKTPQLRNVALTAPYMHDGSEPTLISVMELYDRGGNKNRYLSGEMQALQLTETERADLVALMHTFTGAGLARFNALRPAAP